MASNVCLPQEHGPIHGSNKLQVTILASEWGSSNGGLSTLNKELAIQLAKFSCVEVTLFLLKCCDEDKKAAASYRISIHRAERRPGYLDELDWLSFPPENLRLDVVVGHGVKLGHQAQVIRNSHKCKWVKLFIPTQRNLECLNVMRIQSQQENKSIAMRLSFARWLILL